MSPETNEKRARSPGMPRIEEKGGTYFVNFSLLRDDDVLSEAERETVFRIIKEGDGQRYLLYGAVVMPTHVHLVVQMLADGEPVPLPRIMHHIKGFSAKKVNELRASKGALWRPRSHNRLIVSKRELTEKLDYIFENPRLAGLVKDPDDYPHLWYPGKDTVENPEPGWCARRTQWERQDLSFYNRIASAIYSEIPLYEQDGNL